jgi:multiple sugar transport system ATP-binding protein
MAQTGLRLERLSKVYGDGTAAVREVDLDVAPGEFLTLLGPSGCGKTTTLRLIAGLEAATAGRIFIGGSDVTERDPGDRDIAMVFQSYALYPHMTAAENMTLALETRGMPRADAARRAREVAEILGIGHLLAKKPGQLSGGQRQRVALGRAMVRRPACFLMDEPLSNVDLKLREKMRTELKKLHKDLRVTTIYVTHDQSEALVLSDRIAVMRDGVILQLASPSDIYERPSCAFVAEFVGSPSINLLAGRRTAHGVSVADLPIADLAWAAGGGDVWVGARAEDIFVVGLGEAQLCGRIELVEPVGGFVYYYVAVDGWSGIVKGSDYLVFGQDIQTRIRQNDRVGLRLRGDRLSVFERASGAALVRQ